MFNCVCFPAGRCLPPVFSALSVISGRAVAGGRRVDRASGSECALSGLHWYCLPQCQHCCSSAMLPLATLYMVHTHINTNKNSLPFSGWYVTDVFLCYRDVSILVGLLAVLLGLRFSYPDHEQALWLCAVLVCVMCACRGLSLWRKAVLQRHVQSLAIQMENLVNNSRALTSLSRKSLRLMQETEVISRGFTL